MTNAARQMARNGWWLRSGYAEGADQAFGLGAAQRAEETNIDRWTMFIPWSNYNRAPYGDNRFEVVIVNSQMEFEAKQAYNADPAIQLGKPHWDQLRDPVKLLHMRNVAIVLGPDLQSPVDMLLCWTPSGEPEGGTGQAIRVANQHNIPVFNLANEADRLGASAFVYDSESVYWGIPW